MSDLQNRGAIVFCDRFFDSNGNQVQDMQVAPDPFPATVLMVNAMNTNAALTDLLRQGDIPRLLNQELKKRKPAQKNDDSRSNVDSFFLFEKWTTQDRGSFFLCEGSTSCESHRVLLVRTVMYYTTLVR